MPGKHLTQEQCDRIKRILPTYGAGVTCELTGISTHTLRALKRRGFRCTEYTLRSVPDDWQTVAPGQSVEQLRKHYNASWRVVNRWFAEAPVKPRKPGPTPMPCPPDFGQVIAQRTIRATAAHYGVCRETATKWHREHEAKRLAKRARFGWADQHVMRQGRCDGLA